jgi:hypothetical protein
MTNDKTPESQPSAKSPSRASSNGASATTDKAIPLGDNAGVHIPSGAEDPLRAGGNEVEIDFAGFIISLGTSCMVNLGKFENPETGTTETDLDAARQVIHILSMLRDKTRGNLEQEEERLLSSLIHDLKLAFVQASR